MKIAIYWLEDMSSAGLSKSPMFDIVIIHLKVGAQKNTKRLNYNRKECLYLWMDQQGAIGNFLFLMAKVRKELIFIIKEQS